MFLNALFCSLRDIICLTTIFEAVETTPKCATFAITIVLEDFPIEVLDKGTYCWFLLHVDVFTVKDRPTSCLPTTHSVKPFLQLALQLPEQVVLLNIERAIDNSPCHNIDRLEYRMRLIPTVIEFRVEVYTLLNLTHIFLQNHFVDAEIVFRISWKERITTLLFAQVAKQIERIGLQ